MTLLLLLLTAQDVDAVTGARIITGTGEEIENGTILIREGRIEAVGAGLEIPSNARVLDATGLVVVPGWIEPHATRGIDRANERVPSVPFVSVYDSINPVAPVFEDSRRQGTTTMFVSPGDGGMIAGKGVIVRPVGLTVEEMTVVRDALMKLSLQTGGGQSKMSHLAAMRKEFDDVKDYLEAEKAKKPLPSPAKRAELDAKKQPIADLMAGTLPGIVSCPEPSDVVRAHELATQYGIKATYVVGPEAWRALDYIKKHSLTVVLDATLVYWDTDPDTREQVRRVVPKAFHDAGVPFALQTGNGTGNSEMWFQVATCVKYGVPRDVAIRAATLHGARAIGQEARLGSIEKGKDANLQILTGDPLDVMTWVSKVVIEGRLVYDREQDAKLKRLLGESE